MRRRPHWRDDVHVSREGKNGLDNAESALRPAPRPERNRLKVSRASGLARHLIEPEEEKSTARRASMLLLVGLS